jgi:hypothetical protein
MAGDASQNPPQVPYREHGVRYRRTDENSVSVTRPLDQRQGQLKFLSTTRHPLTPRANEIELAGLFIRRVDRCTGKRSVSVPRATGSSPLRHIQLPLQRVPANEIPPNCIR